MINGSQSAGNFVWGMVGVWVALAIGWVANIFQVATTDNLELSGITIIKVIGIFVPPLGAVMGWVGFF